LACILPPLRPNLPLVGIGFLVLPNSHIPCARWGDTAAPTAGARRDRTPPPQHPARHAARYPQGIERPSALTADAPWTIPPAKWTSYAPRSVGLCSPVGSAGGGDVGGVQVGGGAVGAGAWRGGSLDGCAMPPDNCGLSESNMRNSFRSPDDTRDSNHALTQKVDVTGNIATRLPVRVKVPLPGRSGKPLRTTHRPTTRRVKGARLQRTTPSSARCARMPRQPLTSCSRSGSCSRKRARHAACRSGDASSLARR
jgi:hypothetical protein